MLAWLRGPSWLAFAIIALLALSAVWAIDPIRDAATGGVVAEATLDRSAGYLLIAPISALSASSAMMASASQDGPRNRASMRAERVCAREASSRGTGLTLRGMKFAARRNRRAAN